MKDSFKEKVETAIADWQYMQELPAEWYGFQYRLDKTVYDDVYDIYSYVNEAIHHSVTVYYHEETKEYKLRIRIGQIEFCRIECIAAKLDVFETLLRAQFDDILHDLVEFNPKTVSHIILAKHITEWKYQSLLPETLEGFTLFIRPSEPVRITNGSYIVFDYEDFSCDSNFIIYYNMFRDEFFGEARINNIPDMNYVFDSQKLSELQKKLTLYLIPRLQEIHQRAKEARK